MRVSSTALLLMTILPAWVHSQGVDLGGGIITRTDTGMYAKLALDIRDIRESTDEDEILRIYLDGRNAEETTGFFFPLKKMTDIMGDDETLFTPNYLFHLYGLSGLDAEDLASSNHYSDRFIRSTIASSTSEITADAIIALDTWMYATHLLYKGIDICSRRSSADNPDALESLGGGGMDEFISLWIGEGQTPASSEGHSLYAWAEQASELFGTSSHEARVNEDLKLLYQQGAGVLSLPHACTKEDSGGVKQLWTVAHQMIAKTYIPQFQMLIHSLVNENEDLATLYAMSLIPQISQCRPSVFKRLNDALLSGGISFGKKQEIFNDLEAAMQCFGLTCDDIGTYKDGNYMCSPNIEKQITFLAGYKPTTNVEGLAKLDQDILQIRILTTVGAWHFARDIYRYGRNAFKERESDNDEHYLLSLHELATAADRKRADPYYSYFVAYFNQVNYADNAVDEAFRGVGKWTTEEQRREVIVATCAYQIVFLYMLAELRQTVQQCRDPEFDLLEENIHPWDEVAALLIGSLEGGTQGGSTDMQDGQLIINLANSRAFQFQTLSEEGYSRVSSELGDLLFAGLGELNALDCDNLEKTTKRIEKLVTVPIIQSALRFAAMMEKQSTPEGSVEAALGEVYSFSVLPILSAADAESAEVIRENTEVKDGVNPVRDGAQVVADAFGAAVTEWGLGCPNLGFTSQADPCRLQSGHSKPIRTYTRSAATDHLRVWHSRLTFACVLGLQLVLLV